MICCIFLMIFLWFVDDSLVIRRWLFGDFFCDSFVIFGWLCWWFFRDSLVICCWLFGECFMILMAFLWSVDVWFMISLWFAHDFSNVLMIVWWSVCDFWVMFVFLMMFLWFIADSFVICLWLLDDFSVMFLWLVVEFSVIGWWCFGDLSVVVWWFFRVFPQTKRSLRSEWGSYFFCIELPLHSRICHRGLLA